jgi:hypothetical protein
MTKGIEMMERMFITMLASSLLASVPAMSAPESDALGQCMVDSLNGKERRLMARWIFFAMSAHPEISGYSNVTAALRVESDEYIGELITRLLTSDCTVEAAAAMQTGSSVAMSKAFELVGGVAMQELMNNSDVTGAISGFERYLDKDKLAALE